METKKPFDDAFTFKEDLGVREVFADGIHTIMVGGAIAKFTFTVSRPDEIKPGFKGAPKGTKVPIARVAMPAPAFADMYNKMQQIMLAMEASGLVRREGDLVKATIQ